MKKLQTRSPLKNQKGFLTLDFIFATILMFSFSAILFVFAISFTAMEIAQYAVFASSRAYFSANKDPEAQEQAGKDKFKELVRPPEAPLGTLFRNGWFTISDVQIDDFNEDFAGSNSDNDSATFIGARARVQAKILNIKLPIVGSVSEELGASPASYLMREPTASECTAFTKQRMARVQSLRPGFADSHVDSGAYAVIMDDGC